MLQVIFASAADRRGDCGILPRVTGKINTFSHQPTDFTTHLAMRAMESRLSAQPHPAPKHPQNLGVNRCAFLCPAGYHIVLSRHRLWHPALCSRLSSDSRVDAHAHTTPTSSSPVSARKKTATDEATDLAAGNLIRCSLTAPSAGPGKHKYMNLDHELLGSAADCVARGHGSV